MLGTELQDFQLKVEQNKTVDFTWERARELNTAFYEIEAFEEKVQGFLPITRTKAADIAATANNYAHKIQTKRGLLLSTKDC